MCLAAFTLNPLRNCIQPQKLSSKELNSEWHCNDKALAYLIVG